MPKTKVQKQELLDQIKDRLLHVKGAVFTSFSKVNVKNQQRLRSKLKERGIFFKVWKKTLLKKALQESSIDCNNLDEWYGSVGFASSDIDEVASAQVISQFLTEIEGLEIKAGLLDRYMIKSRAVMELARLPSKQELIRQTVYVIQYPLARLVNLLYVNQRNLINVLINIRAKKN